jgi:hypothetical protein
VAGEGAGPRREHQGERGQHEAEDVHAGAVVVERSNPQAAGGGGAPIKQSTQRTYTRQACSVAW